MSVVLVCLAAGAGLVGAALIGSGSYAMREDEDDGRWQMTTGEITLVAALVCAFFAGRWSL